MYRNPSPPPQECPVTSMDRIGETAYSQCWVLKALATLSAQEQKEDDQLPEELENEFCQLWDMSSDKQVGMFMLEKGVCDMLLAPMVRSANYRVREVSLGIIGNLMCHPASAKQVTDHQVLRTYIPTLTTAEDVSVLTETVRLLRAALTGTDQTVVRKWHDALPDNIVEQLIHIMQNTLKMTSVRSKVLTEHCAHLLEILFYMDSKLLSNSAYTVFPIVDILKKRQASSMEEPLLRCLQYLSEGARAVQNMAQCPNLPDLPGVLHFTMSEKIDHSLVAVCLSLVCTLLTSPGGTDEMCAWLEKDCNIIDTAIRTLKRIIQDDKEEIEENKDNSDSNRKTESDDTKNDQPTVVGNDQPNATENDQPDAPQIDQERQSNGHETAQIDTPSPKSADRLKITPSSPIRLVTPTYGTPCAVPTPSSNANTPQSTLSTPYSLQRRGIFTPSERIRRVTSEPSRPIIIVCKEMCWHFLYTLANQIPTEGSCILRYISDLIRELIYCFKSDGDRHVELAMLYKQHLEKYPHFSKSSGLLARFIASHITNDTP